MKICLKCKKQHNRATKLCNACYINQPHQIEFKRARTKKAWEKEKLERKQKRSKLKCLGCGKLFEGKRSDQQYCSRGCRDNLKTKESRGIKQCIICKKIFKQIRRDSKCCSLKCIKKWEYKKRDKNKKKHYDRIREYKQRGAIGSHTFKEWEQLKKILNYKCQLCGKKEPDIVLTKDHIIPICKGGGNDINNIQPLCGKCNSKKGGKVLTLNLSYDTY